MTILNKFIKLKRLIQMLLCCDIPIRLIGKVGFKHPTGIVVSTNAKFGKNVIIYSKATIGKRRKGFDGYPTIGDNVIIYTGAIVVGNIKIGNNSIIGAYKYVNKDVPPNTIIK